MNKVVYPSTNNRLWQVKNLVSASESILGYSQLVRLHNLLLLYQLLLVGQQLLLALLQLLLLVIGPCAGRNNQR